MKLATIGIGDGACLHKQFCARAVQRRLGKRKFGHGWRGNERHDDRIFRDRNDIRQCDGCNPTPACPTAPVAPRPGLTAG